MQAAPVAPRGSHAAAAIPVERIAGPILTAAGTADGLWTSAASQAAIAARRRSHGVGAHDVALLFPAAGHLVDAALPSTSEDDSPLDTGGDAGADEAARARVWPTLLAFLRAVPA